MKTPKFTQVSTATGQYGSVITALGDDGIVYQWNRPGEPTFDRLNRWTPLLNPKDE